MQGSINKSVHVDRLADLHVELWIQDLAVTRVFEAELNTLQFCFKKNIWAWDQAPEEFSSISKHEVEICLVWKNIMQADSTEFGLLKTKHMAVFTYFISKFINI